MPARAPFHVMVKPSGAQCNLDCGYCFYLPKQHALGQPETPRMDARVLEAHIRQYISGQDAGAVVFSWQGGEPTLMGLDFFRRVVELQARVGCDGHRNRLCGADRVREHRRGGRVRLPLGLEQRRRPLLHDGPVWAVDAHRSSGDRGDALHIGGIRR